MPGPLCGDLGCGRGYSLPCLNFCSLVSGLGPETVLVHAWHPPFVIPAKTPAATAIALPANTAEQANRCQQVPSGSGTQHRLFSGAGLAGEQWGEAGVSRPIPAPGTAVPRPGLAGSRCRSSGGVGGSRSGSGSSSLRMLRRRLWLAGSKPRRLFTLPWLFPRCADVTKAVA